MRWLFTWISLLTCAVLIPINVSYNLNNIDEKKRDILSILTIRDVHGNWLYAHVILTYLITFLIVFCVDMNWRAMVRLRRTWFRSPEYLQSFYSRTLQVRHVPKNLQTDEGIRAIFESVKVPYPTTSVHIGRKVGKLPDLIEYHNQTVREFEEVLVKYLKGGKIRSKRPTIRIGGTCGFGGTTKDAIDWYTCVFSNFALFLLKTQISFIVLSLNAQMLLSKNTEVRLIPGKLKTMDLPAWPRFLMLMLSRRCFAASTPREHASTWLQTPRTSYVTSLEQ